MVVLLVRQVILEHLDHKVVMVEPVVMLLVVVAVVKAVLVLLAVLMVEEMVVLEYDFHFTNGSENRDKEFSADDLGTLETMIAYATANVALSLWCVHLRERLKRRRKFHHTVALLVWSIFVQTAGCVLGLIHWSVFSRDGGGSPATLQTSVFLRHAADLLVVLLVVLLAKGWTIVRRKLSANGRVRVALYMTVLAGARRG